MTLALPQSVPAAGAPVAVPFARDLARHGDRLAVVAGDQRWTYRELAQQVDATAARLGGGRRLVLVSGANDAAQLVTYLAALVGGHVALLVPPAHAGTVAAAYDPDAVLPPGGELEVRRRPPAHDLHPELALLMSTSGSTGSPKLARLSHRNVQANAESIAQFLGVRDTDRAVTTLPLHYVYGLSVVHTHLLRGATVVLSDLSVADSCFWDLFEAEGGTTLAGVPHTFDLLDRVGFDRMRLPRLRYVTQAGGRLDPGRVRRYAELGRRGGWDFVVMYGQTEATARMAYLPPELAAAHPSAVGVPIPGGSFVIEPAPEVTTPGVGELVYHGPNVMLGYASEPADLALGRTVTALRTGDLARRTPEGLVEIVGRRSRFVKIAGLRVDLDHLETALSRPGVAVRCTGADGELLVAVDGAEPDAVRREIADRFGLPVRAVTVAAVAPLPRLANGKVDYPELARLVTSAAPAAPVASAAVGSSSPGDLPERLRALYAELLGRPDATLDSTFVDLGGDSLSYVEMSIRLEDELGVVPPNWHVTPLRELAAGASSLVAVEARGWRRVLRLRRLETSAALRALAIVCVISTHAGLFTLLGGAHVLVAVAGFNFARFRLTSAGRVTRLRQQAVSIARIAVPSVIWIAGVVLLTNQYGPLNIVLMNGLFGPSSWTSEWHFWFVEVLVYILVVLAALLAIPSVDRLERRFPLVFPAVLLGFGLLGRYGIVDLGVPHTMPVFWLFAFGWAAARSTTWWQRLALTAVLAATVPGFFGQSARELAIVAGIASLLWLTTVPVPSALSRVVSVLASSSLYVYLTHWQVYPRLNDIHPGLAVAGSLAVGVAAWWLAGRLTGGLTMVGWTAVRQLRSPSTWASSGRRSRATRR
ncbi:AMP-binding protein [Jiangella mangrovi]|uniref:Acyl-CoA synthetase (AMP-forming)/AMP-acid ligase II/acyl carrier protein n=1 Tax=Jiangella mangrovi TaxID=1524084 RepID=A0A7W9GXR1_9ACTN|nr:AMP-binding protein [Jiangella mangrovi]MBB5791947.1 acyl-CoA synthetase (AMP-forming)/AMP-acid ligase II/acyl carrier protein [Jiangella mangrovi]